MALPIREQAKYWGIAMAIFFAVLWFLGDVILPFVLGGAIAYLLDPAADRLEAIGLSRGIAVGLITILALLFFVVLVWQVLPLLIQQAQSLFATAPDLFGRLQAFVEERFPSLITDGGIADEQLAAIGEFIQSRGSEIVNGLLTSVSGIFNTILLFVIVPVVAFYLLLDWDRMVSRIDDQIPRDHVRTIRDLARQIDRTLASFIRGQGTVCLILGAYYAIALMLVGLNFGLVVGAIAGALTFIPYVGAVVGGALAVGLALYQFWGDWVWIVAVALIFQSGQMIEGNVLTPKLVGSSVGLHPVWLLFALSVFGTLFGFVGLLVGVPVAAVIGVLVRFALHRYKSSPLYLGTPDN
jgi:predicted PurR-regulated permease PerM